MIETMSGGRVRDKIPVGPVVVGLIFLIGLVNPVGFGGGGADDRRYLDAATCWIAYGPCLPTEHWGGRWPVVLVTAASIRLFGMNELALGLPFALLSAANLVLLANIGNRLYGKSVGTLASGILAATPAFLIEVSHPAVEPIELFLLLITAKLALDRRFLLAGLSLGLAFQTRETAVAALPVMTVLLWRNWRALIAVGLGFLTPFLAEMVIYFWTTGNPLWRRELSLAHTKLPSSELPSYDGELPFFNRSLLENWKYEPGIRLHWLIDGFANLLVNPKTTFLFLVAPLFAWLARERRARTIPLLLGAFGYAAILIYVLCIDPKPRMMTAILAALSLATAISFSVTPTAVKAGLVAVILPFIMIIFFMQPRVRNWTATAEKWAAELDDNVTIKNAKGWLLGKKLYQLEQPGKDYVIVYRNNGCTPTALREKRNNSVATLIGVPKAICLYRAKDFAEIPSSASLVPTSESSRQR